MQERFNIHREVRRILAADRQHALEVLPALAGEILAAEDPVAISEVNDALSMSVLEHGNNHDVAEAVLAMVRAMAISRLP